MCFVFVYNRQGTLFWTDVRQRTVAMSQLDGSNATLLVDTDLTFPGTPMLHHHALHVYILHNRIELKNIIVD